LVDCDSCATAVIDKANRKEIAANKAKG